MARPKTIQPTARESPRRPVQEVSQQAPDNAADAAEDQPQGEPAELQFPLRIGQPGDEVQPAAQGRSDQARR